MIDASIPIPVFEHSGALITTSLKCGYSFFNNHERFVKTFWNHKTLLHALGNRLFNTRPVFCFYRNPVRRFASFFEDKFRKEPARILGSDVSSDDCLQHCQTFILRRLGKECSPVETGCESLLNVRMTDLYDLLPELIYRDLHLIPQFCSFQFNWRGIRFNLRARKMFDLDQADDLREFESEFDLSMSRKSNRTKAESCHMSGEFVDRLKQVYSSDCAFFDRAVHLSSEDRWRLLVGEQRNS